MYVDEMGPEGCVAMCQCCVGGRERVAAVVCSATVRKDSRAASPDPRRQSQHLNLSAANQEGKKKNPEKCCTYQEWCSAACQAVAIVTVGYGGGGW